MRQSFSFDLKLCIALIFTFIAMTVIGTVSHELGHYSAARLLGYEACIDYRSAHWKDTFDVIYNEMYEQYGDQIRNQQDYPRKKEFLQIQKEYFFNRI
jgi:hypothetical protein